MVTNHNYTKVVISMPCREDMGLLDIANLYLEWVFPYVGILEKIISDQDIWFISKIFNELCEMLQIKQNIVSVYHPLTDEQSEKTNQHIETTLWNFGNFWQDNWSELLPIVQYQLNLQFSASTKQIFYETWMGFVSYAY